MNEIIWGLFTTYVFPALGTGLAVLSAHLLFRLKAKINNDEIKMATDQLDKATKNVVSNLNQTLVPILRDKSRDGSLSNEDKVSVKNKAIVMIKAQMQTEFIELLNKSSIDLDSLLNTTIEASVFELNCKE